jgi:hypothetical protein
VESEYRPIRARIEVPPALSYNLDSEIIAEVTRRLPQHLAGWDGAMACARAQALLSDPTFFRNWLLGRHPSAIVGYANINVRVAGRGGCNSSPLARFLASKIGSCFSMWEGGITVFSPDGPLYAALGCDFPVDWPEEYLSLEDTDRARNTPVTVEMALAMLDRAVATPRRVMPGEVVSAEAEAGND